MRSKPGNWVKQSIPFSYFFLTAISLDNLAHDMQVYSGIDGGINIVFRSPYYDLTISAGWISQSGDTSSLLNNNVTSNMDAIYHTIAFSEPVSFDSRTGWGTLYYATKNVSDYSSSISSFTLMI
jgi:hypothetical protein